MHQDDHTNAGATRPAQHDSARRYVSPALQRFGTMRELTELSLGQLLFGWFLGRGNAGGNRDEAPASGGTPPWGGPPNPEQPALPPRHS